MASINSAPLNPFEFGTSFKALEESSNIDSVPSKFKFSNDRTALTSASLPVIDFSALISSDSDQRSRAVHDLSNACRKWGFFILVNHGIPETLMSGLFELMKEFFDLPDSEKKQYEAKSASDPIKCGNLNVTTTSSQSFTLWREYLKLYVHPKFHCPKQPQLLSEVVKEYSKITRGLVIKLMEGVCEALELDPSYVEETLKMSSSFQIFATNYYPRCPNPDQAIGIPLHTDPGLFTFLIHNGVAGLQIEHDGKWFNADSPTNSILVSPDDQLEILSNGRYKSVKHRAVVNAERDRMSIVLVNGPSREVMVGPAAALMEKDGRALYTSMKYEDYVETQLTKSRHGGKSLLEQQMIFDEN